MKSAVVGILMGSDSDWEVMKGTTEVLDQFQVPYEVQVMSAHRSPQLVGEYAASARERGLKVIIVAAGGSAHLAGVVAAHTTLPVIGVPLNATPLAGFDALLSTVQMPPGIPVATVAVGKFGAQNAAILAVQILGVEDGDMRAKLEAHKKRLAENVAMKNRKLQDVLEKNKLPQENPSPS